jgi:hypothetical protein
VPAGISLPARLLDKEKSMKYRLEGVTIEACDTYVRVTVGACTKVTDQQCPKSIEVAILLEQMQGYAPNRAQLQACGRAADDAKRNKTLSARTEKNGGAARR